MLAIGLACFSILGAAREALYNKPGRSPSTAAHFAVGSMRLLQVGRVFCSYVSSPPTLHFHNHGLQNSSDCGASTFIPTLALSPAQPRDCKQQERVCLWGTGRGLILPPFGFKTNKGSGLGKSDLPPVRVPDRTRQGLPPARLM